MEAQLIASALDKLDVLTEATKKLTAAHGAQNEALKIFDERLGDIEADLSRLRDLAEQAEKFLHNPIGAYKAARLGKIRVPDVPA